MSTLIQRLVLFILAVITDLILSGIYGYSSDTFIWAVLAGVQALIIFEIIYRTQPWVRWYTLPVYFAVFLVLRAFTGNLFWGIWYDDPYAYEILWDIGSYGYAFTAPYFLITGVLVVLASYFLLSGLGKFGGQTDASEKVMLEISDDLVTRLLCASAITQGLFFRKKVMDRVKNKYTAVAPEFGLDLELVTGVCQYLERRETKFQIAFFIAGLIGIALLSTPIGLLILILLTAPIMFVKKYYEKFNLLKNFTSNDYSREKVKAQFAIEENKEISEGLPKPEQNVIVYGGFSPFVGAGIDLGGWSFALDVSRSKEQLVGDDEGVRQFSTVDLYKEIEKACKSLHIPNLQVSDLSFVSGRDIRNDRSLLPNSIGRPVQHVDNKYLKSVDEFKLRQYKHISVSAWGNDVVFSIFMRSSIKGKNLFVEVARYLLPPVGNQYRNFNQSTNKSWANIAGVVLSSLVLGPIYGLFAWMILVGKFFGFLGNALGLQDRTLRNEIKRNPDYNYGVKSSLREEVGGNNFLHYFQKLDREMYVKILDSEILETLIRFLDDHNIDTSQLRERQTTILNNGIIVQGGNVEGQSIAVGQGSRSVLNQLRSPARKE